MKFIRKHTPGPWRIDDGIVAFDDIFIVSCGDYGEVDIYDHDKHLIAQAPEMLDYLIERAHDIDMRLSMAGSRGDIFEMARYEKEQKQIMEIIKKAGVEVIEG